MEYTRTPDFFLKAGQKEDVSKDMPQTLVELKEVVNNNPGLTCIQIKSTPKLYTRYQ